MDEFAHHMQANDVRLRELEGTFASMENVSVIIAICCCRSVHVFVSRCTPQSPALFVCFQTRQGSGPPGGVVGGDAKKLKLRLDELQTILAAEIKSRNTSERELEQQILSTRENFIHQEGGGNVGAVFAKKLAELSDKLHYAEAGLQLEGTERGELQRQLAAITALESSVEGKIKKLQTDLEKEKFMHKVAADERKRQTEQIREAEGRLVEANERLEECDLKRRELQKESRAHVESLQRQLAEQAEEFRLLLHESQRHTDEVAADVQAKAAREAEARFREHAAKAAAAEKSMHAALGEGLRELHNDVRVDRESAEASLQEMKQVLSAEITSRRKAVGKTNANVDKVFATQEDVIKNMRKLKEIVDENVKEINSGLCKIAAGFSEQLITLQDVTKTAVRTLQIDQVSLAAKLKNATVEYKQLHSLLADRADLFDKSLEAGAAALKSQGKALHSRVDQVSARVDEQVAELGSLVLIEAKTREDGLRSAVEAMKASAEKCESLVSEVASDLASKLDKEAEARSSDVANAEKRLQDCLAKQAEQAGEMNSLLEETFGTEISYAISMENQARCRQTQKVSKSLREELNSLAQKSSELVAAESVERAAALAQSAAALQACEHALACSEAKMTATHADFVSGIRIDFEERDMSATMARCRLQRQLVRQSKSLNETDENLRQLISVQQQSHESGSEKMLACLAECNDRFMSEVGAVRAAVDKSSKSVLREVDRKEKELLRRLKQELMEQLLTSHVRAQVHRKRVENELCSLQVRGCLDGLVHSVVEQSVSQSLGAQVAAASSDTSEAKEYVDLATKFLDKKLMAGFEDYGKRLSRGLGEVREDVTAANSAMLEQVEINDRALLEHLQKIHNTSSERRQKLEESLRVVEVSSCVDRMVSSIVESHFFAPAAHNDDDPSSWDTRVDESSGSTYYLNKRTQATQWEPPLCLQRPPASTVVAPTDAAQPLPPDSSESREEISAEIDKKVGLVGAEVQTLQARVKEAEELLQSYDMPVMISNVHALRHDLDDATEELHGMREQLGQLGQNLSEAAAT